MLRQPTTSIEPVPRLIDERELESFRARHLSVPALLRLAEDEVRALVRLGVGIGKSHAIDNLLGSPETYAKFDLVVYVAPAWAILNERRVVRNPASSPVPFRLIKPRPIDRCGPYKPEWRRLEDQLCVAYAKGTLCRACQAGRLSTDRCFWPTQFSDLDGVKLVLVTEAQLLRNRALLRVIVNNAGANRPLVLLDEAEFIERPFDASISIDDLRTFRESLLRSIPTLSAREERLAEAWVSEIDSLIESDSAALSECQIDFSNELARAAFRLQDVGLAEYGSRYKFVAYDLLSLKYSSPESRRKDASGTIRFVGRPYLGAHLLIFSALLDAQFVAHRLRRDWIASPFERTIVRHSGSRVVNVRNSIGAKINFKRASSRVLDAFAVSLFDNVVRGKSTVLIACKEQKDLCRTYLTRRLRHWGAKVRIVDGDALGAVSIPEPRVIPVLHYGVRGINAFQNYECCYCLSSFYANPVTLNAQVHELEPDGRRTELRVTVGSDRVRRVTPVHPSTADPGLTELGNLYLRKLEVDPAIQAVGRVRFLTLPRTVVFFTMHPIEDVVGPVENCDTLGEMLRNFGLPSAKELDRFIESMKAKGLIKTGLTAAQTARRMGFSRRTLFARLHEDGSAIPNVLQYFLTASCTPPEASTEGGAPEAAS